MVQRNRRRIKTNKREIVKFMVARGTAIESYSRIEQALVELFAHLIGTSPDYAGIPFFRINNARARNAIIEKLLKKRHGATFNLFWNSLLNGKHGLNVLDGERNEIVHWGMLAIFGKSNKLKGVKLIPQNYWDRNSNTPKKTTVEMWQFISKCKFFSRALDMLRYVAAAQKPEHPAWRDICQLPIVYPPPDNHLLSPKRKELKIPHLPFPA